MSQGSDGKGDLQGTVGMPVGRLRRGHLHHRRQLLLDGVEAEFATSAKIVGGPELDQ